MAASIRSGSGQRQQGYTYLGVLFLIILMGAALASTGQVWSNVARRDHERELLWVGNQYAQALLSYYHSSPGLAQYPEKLEELLEDHRFPFPKRHLRRLYPDPIGSTGEWGLLRGFDNRITGVYSQSQEQPLKQAGFPIEWVDFNGMNHYSDWQFVAQKGFLDNAGGAATGSSSPLSPLSPLSPSSPMSPMSQ
ncbi:type II secretion system protein [Pseudomonas sp. H11T01]|uniref:type II secretion system protein n=1 Tax=Pseudomonas sp. H11T01 TaxID=3402749 RepID=UPI003AC48BBE